MKNETKNKILQWLNFGLTVLSIIGKVIVEIVENLPPKDEQK